MDTSNNVHHQLVVAFPDQSASFAYGFEAGKLWAEMVANTSAKIDVVTRVENREVIGRMGIAQGWDVEYKSSEIEGWDYTTLRKVRSAPDKSNPNGLRLV